MKNPENISKDVSKIGHRGNGDYRVNITPEDDLDLSNDINKTTLQKTFIIFDKSPINQIYLKINKFRIKVVPEILTVDR